MLKKSLSVFLCIVMCISFFSMSAVDTLAAYNVKTLFSVKGEAIEDNKLNYSISVTKDQKGIGGIILVVEYDSSVLKPTNCAPAERTTAEEGTVKNFEGTYAYGVSEDNPDIYSIAYMNTMSVSTTDALTFFNMEFEVIDESRPTTSVRFYCKEYYSTSEPDKNITVADGLQLIAEFADISTLAKPVLKEVVPHADGLKVSWEPVEGAVGYEIRRTSPYSTWESVGEVGAENTEFVDTGLKSGTVYTYTVRAFNNYGISLYDAVGVSCEYVEKPVVTSLRNAVGGVEIKWSETSGADFYILLRRQAGGTEWEEIARRTFSAGTAYKDTTVVDGVTYEYDVNSATDSFTSVTSDLGMSITYIESPGITSVSNTLKGIEIKWNAHPNATHYIVYRKAVGVDSQLLEYAQSSKNSFTDNNVTAGKTYTYSVKACTNSGDSAYSVTGYTITHVPSTEVTGLSLERNAVKVEWKGVNGVTGYSIYRKTPAESTWTKVGTVDGGTLSFSDTSAASGTEYVYAVCPMISVSEGAKVASQPVYYIKAPENTAAENLIEGIKVTWLNVNGATKYEVMRADLNGNVVKLADVSATDSLEYIDKDVVWEETYVYAVKAVSPKGESLVGNSTASVLRLGAMGIATPELCEGGIKVTWEPRDRADAYAVFRNTNGEWSQIATVNEVEYLDENVESAEVYSYAVAVIINESRGVVDTNNAPELTYIAPPETIKTVNGADCTTVSWSAVNGAIGYKIYRYEGGSVSRKMLIADVDGETLSYTDKKVVAGKTYNYIVKTVDFEKTSVDSVPTTNTFLSVPNITSISNAYTGVTISWDAVQGAQKYNIYRKIYGENWVLVTTVSADELTYTDTGATNGKLIYYAVRAVNDTGISTYNARGITYVTAPKLAHSNSASGIYLKWDVNSEAQSYWVYRKAGNAKYWTRIAIVTNNYYTDKNVKSGTDYTYTVRAYNGKILSGYNTAGWRTKYLSIPKITSVSNTYGAVTVSWNKVSGAAKYYVYRKVDGAKTWTYVGSVTSNSYRDTNVKNKSTYAYTVRAVNGSSISYYNTVGKSVKCVLTPTVTVANRIDSVQLTWNAVSGASSYYVYRKANRETTWTKIATVTKNSYTDTKVVNGATYRYTVRAYSSKTLSGYNGNGWATVYLAAPKLVSATSYASGISVKWKPVKWATGYFIFRKTDNGNWVQIGTVKGSNTVTYLDKTAQLGGKYTYTVRAYYGNYRSWFYPGLTCIDKY